MTTRPALGSSQSTQWKFQLKRSVSRVSCIFQAISQLFTKLCNVFYKLPSDVVSLQSPGRRNISELYLYWSYCGYSFICFTACLQLVKVSLVYVFLGRSMLETDSESQKDQYLFEICPVEHSAINFHQNAISCFSSYSSKFTACPCQKFNIVLYLLGSDLLVQSKESQDA